MEETKIDAQTIAALPSPTMEPGRERGLPVLPVKSPVPIAQNLKKYAKNVAMVGLILAVGSFLGISQTTALIVLGGGCLIWVFGDRMENPKRYIDLANNLQGFAKGVRQAGRNISRDTEPLYGGKKGKQKSAFGGEIRIGPPKI